MTTTNSKPADVERLTREQIAGAVARGWCWKRNEHKEMDSDLASAITDEVCMALRSDRDAIIEECARVCDKLADDIDMEKVPDIRGETAANRLATALRALNPPKEPTDDK